MTVPADASRRRWPVALGVLVLIVALAALALTVTRNRADWLVTGTAATTSEATSGATSTSTATTAAPATTSAAPTTSSTTPATSSPAPPPAAGVPPSLRGQDVEVVPTTERVVALTFDGGANADALESILATLTAEDVPASFFVTAQFAEAFPDGVAAIAAAGHRLGNHSVTHAAFTTLSDAAIRDEVLGAETAIRAAGGDPRPLFRFPLGDRDARTIAAVNDLGYLPVRWTVDTLGWKGTSGGMTAQGVCDRVVAGLQPGEIVLMHVGSNPDDGSTLDADALPEIIAQLRGAGYSFVTLDVLLQA
jgi:peptidoglycan/xylan/chitin deacetylase (PgdA/CDA1 family)